MLSRSRQAPCPWAYAPCADRMGRVKMFMSDPTCTVSACLRSLHGSDVTRLEFISEPIGTVAAGLRSLHGADGMHVDVISAAIGTASAGLRSLCGSDGLRIHAPRSLYASHPLAYNPCTVRVGLCKDFISEPLGAVADGCRSLYGSDGCVKILSRRR